MTDMDAIRMARRALGKRLAAIRVAAGLTQHQLAPLVFYVRSTVANAETGRQATGRTFWERCDTVLNAGGDLLAEYDSLRSLERRHGDGAPTAGLQHQQRLSSVADPNWTNVAAPEAPELPAGFDGISSWMAADTVELISQLTRKDLTLDRREVTKLLGSAAFGSPLLEAIERWIATGLDRSHGSRSGAVGQQEIDQIEQAARIFRQWDDQFGGGLRRKAVIGQLSEVSHLVRDCQTGNIRQRLYGAMAQLAETAAIMSWDSGQQSLAQRYYVMSLRAAKNAGDKAFAANVLAGMARQLLYLGHADDALELVRIALDRYDHQMTPAVRAMLHTREAWAFAGLSRVTAFRTSIDKAERALSATGSDPEPHWISYFDNAELQGTVGGRLLDLARRDARYAPEAAAKISSAIHDRTSGHLRSSALDEIGLAEALFIQGEYDQVEIVAHMAIERARLTASDRVRTKLGNLYRRSESVAKLPAIAQVRREIESVLN